MPRSYTKKAKTALNPFGFIQENLAFPLREGLIVVLTRQSKEEYYGNVSTEIQTGDMVEHAKKLVVDPDKQVLLIDENLQEDGSIKSVSGTWGTDKRKGLAQLYEAMANGHQGQRVVLVLSFAEDRMFRDDTALEVNNYIQIALTYSVQTKIYQSGKIYNFKNAWDKKEFRAKCEWAADELNVKIIGRMLGARERMLERGEYSRLGCLALGFTRCNDKLDEEGKPNKYYRKPIPYAPQAKVIKHFFTRYYETSSTAIVYNEDIRGRYVFPPLEPGIFDFYAPDFNEHGAKLSHTGLRSILTNPMYIGWWFDKVNGRWLKNNHPAIVEEDMFWYAFNQLSRVLPDGTPNPDYKQRIERSPKAGNAVGVLTGRLYPLAEDKLVHTRRWKGAVTYEVFSRNNPGERDVDLSIAANDLDAFFVSLLKEKLNDSKQLRRFKEFEQKALAEKVNKVTAREVELKGIAAQMQDIEERISVVKSKKLLEKLDAEYSKLEARKKELEEAPVVDNQPNKKQRKRYDYYTLLEKLGPKLDRLGLEEKMILVEATAEAYIEPLTRGFYRLVVDWCSWEKEEYIVQRKYGASVQYSEEEDEIIRLHYPTATPEEIMKLVPSKSWSSIKFRAFSMKVKREQYTTYTDRRIAKYSLEDIELMDKYGIDPAKKAVKIPHIDANQDEGTLLCGLNRFDEAVLSRLVALLNRLVA